MSVTTMTIDELCVSPFNVRKRPHSPQQVANLAESILARGLIFPLVVHPMALLQKKSKLHGAIAGSGRYNAFKLLIADGRLPSAHPIDVIVRDIKDEGELRDLSLAENLVRLNLYPFEVFAATARAHICGRTFKEIADDTGQTIDTIRKWVRLGNLHPDVFQALEDGAIGEEQAQAIAATEDQALQHHVYQQILPLPIYQRSPAAIRKLLKIGNDELEVKLRFVGEQAYRNAGGRYELDLFADEAEQRGRVEDEGLLMQMVEAKLERARQLLRVQLQNGAPGRDLRFVPGLPRNGDYGGIAHELEIHAEAQLDPADIERFASISTEMEELEKRAELIVADADLDPAARDKAIAELDVDYEPLEQELAAIEARRTLDLPDADIFATLEIDQDGALEQRFWWADRKAKRKAEEAARKQSDVPAQPVSAGPIAKAQTSDSKTTAKRLTGGAAIDGGEGYGVRSEANAQIREDHGITADGIQAIRSIRREMLRAALVQDARSMASDNVATDYLLWSLARERVGGVGITVAGARSYERGMAGLSVRQDLLPPSVTQHVERTEAHRIWKAAVADIKKHSSMTETDLVQAFDDFVAEDWSFKQLVAAIVAGCALERSANVGGYEIELHDHVALLAGCGAPDAQRALVEPTEELIGTLPRTRQLELVHPYVSNTEYLRLDKLKASDVTAPIVRALKKAKDWVHPLLRFSPRIIAKIRHDMREAAE